MLDDLRFALRRLLSAPLFALAAIATLALGIGANTAIFSVADAVLFRPLPYAAADELHVLQMREVETGARATLVDYTFLKAIDEHHGGLSAVGLLESGQRLVYTDASGSDYVPLAQVTANYFDLLGGRAARGRLITATDDTASGRPAMLSHELWRTRFGERDAIVGRPLTIGTTTFDIVGVLPRDFVFPSVFARPSAIVTVMPPLARKAEGGTFHPIVRRGPGVTRQQAQDEIDALIRPLVVSKQGRAYLPYLEDVRSVLYPTGRPIMGMLFAAASLLLLLGCANLSNMLLARARKDERDCGIRIALGATRGRLVRLVACEALLIGLIGSALALVVTSMTFDLLLKQVPPIAYGRAPVGVDLRVFAFGAALGVIAALAVAAIPAWRTTRFDAQFLVQQRDAVRSRSVGRPMVAVQVAMAVVLVFGAAVTARALLSILNVPLGFSPDRVATIGVAPALRGVALQDFYLRAFETLARRADVVAAGAATSLPLSLSTADQAVAVNGVRHKAVAIYHVLPGYFETLAMPLRRGRLLDANDARSGASVAVVSEAAVRVLFPDRDPIGASVSTPSGGTFTVVGVVADIRRSLDQESTHPVYVLPHEAIRAMTIVGTHAKRRRRHVGGSQARHCRAVAEHTRRRGMVVRIDRRSHGVPEPAIPDSRPRFVRRARARVDRHGHPRRRLVPDGHPYARARYPHRHRRDAGVARGTHAASNADACRHRIDCRPGGHAMGGAARRSPTVQGRRARSRDAGRRVDHRPGDGSAGGLASRAPRRPHRSDRHPSRRLIVWGQTPISGVRPRTRSAPRGTICHCGAIHVNFCHRTAYSVRNSSLVSPARTLSEAL